MDDGKDFEAYAATENGKRSVQCRRVYNGYEECAMSL